MNDLMDKYPMPKVLSNISAELAAIKADSEQFVNNADVLESIFNCIDLTTLSTTDSATSVRNFVNKVNTFATDYPAMKNVGGICVYSVFAPVLSSTLKVAGVNKAVVSACFPSSQTFTDVKCAETSKAVEFGANEVDIVISVGEFLDGNQEFVAEEIASLKEAAGNAHLKVILETGALETPENIWQASIIAMQSGADFIKTSTGKISVGATPEAAFVMCQAIKAFEAKEGRKVGFKPAGGVSTVEDALLYYNIVRTVLGQDWLINSKFRIGASRLANALLSKVLNIRNNNTDVVKYF